MQWCHLLCRWTLNSLRNKARTAWRPTWPIDWWKSRMINYVIWCLAGKMMGCFDTSVVEFANRSPTFSIPLSMIGLSLAKRPVLCNFVVELECLLRCCKIHCSWKYRRIANLTVSYSLLVMEPFGKLRYRFKNLLMQCILKRIIMPLKPEV